MKDCQNILIVRTDRIGDVVLTTPAIKALRQNFPYAKISILVTSATKDLVEGNPHLNEILIDDKKGFLGFWKLVFLLRPKKFDCAIIFHTKKRTNALCFLAGIPRRVGYCNDKWGFLLTQKIDDQRHRGMKHESQYCLDVLRCMDLDVSKGLNPEIIIQSPWDVWAKGFLKEQGLQSSDRLFAIHLGASGPPKRWPVKRFAELMEQLARQYQCKFVVIGTADTADLVEELKSQTKVPFVDAVGKTSLGQLMSLLRECQILISNDSGPVHIAAALGIPVVSIFTRNQPGINTERWQPLGDRVAIVASPYKEWKESAATSEKMDPADLEYLQTHRVLEAVDGLYKLC